VREGNPRLLKHVEEENYQNGCARSRFPNALVGIMATMVITATMAIIMVVTGIADAGGPMV
jgi:hypothetical protein